MANLAAGYTRSGSSTGAHEDAGHDLAVVTVGGVVHDRRHRRHVVGRQPVDDGAVALATGQPQHPLAQGGHHDRYRLRRHRLEPEPVDGEGVEVLLDLLAAHGGPQEADHVPDVLVRLLERDAVPALDDDVGGGADPDGEATGRGLGQRAHRLGEAGRPAGETPG